MSTPSDLRFVVSEFTFAFEVGTHGMQWMTVFSASRRFRSLVTFPMICFLCAGGHLSVKMKEKYSHTRQEAKRQAIATLDMQ